MYLYLVYLLMHFSKNYIFTCRVYHYNCILLQYCYFFSLCNLKILALSILIFRNVIVCFYIIYGSRNRISFFSFYYSIIKIKCSIIIYTTITCYLWLACTYNSIFSPIVNVLLLQIPLYELPAPPVIVPPVTTAVPEFDIAVADVVIVPPLTSIFHQHYYLFHYYFWLYFHLLELLFLYLYYQQQYLNY